MVDVSEDFVPLDEVQDVADRIIKLHSTSNSNDRIIVGIAGRPGCGKTCLASIIAKEIHDRTHNGVSVTVMPMDGYHLYREELSRLPNSEYAFSRRGAHWTFNPAKLHSDLMRISTSEEEVRVPSFDHSLRDPKENDILIPKDTQIVLVEGNYLLYTEDPAWNKVSSMFQLKVFLDCDSAECTERLTLRHMKAWNITREEALSRAKGSDSKNGDLIDTTKGNADVICHSSRVFSK